MHLKPHVRSCLQPLVWVLCSFEPNSRSRLRLHISQRYSDFTEEFAKVARRETQVLVRFFTDREAGRLTKGEAFHQASSVYTLFRPLLHASQRIPLTSSTLYLPCTCEFSMLCHTLLSLPVASSHTIILSRHPYLSSLFSQ